MGFDSGYGIGSLKPGVCTSTTRPASAYDGQMIYETDTNLVRIWNGTAWKTLSYSDYTSGSVIQVVSTTKTDGFSTTSTSYVDVTGLSVTITPTSASSTVLVLTGLALGSAATGRAYTQLLRGSTNIATSTGFAERNQTSATYDAQYRTHYVSLAHMDSPATTSATTYKFQLKVDSATTAYVNTQGVNTGIGNVSTLTVMEIAG